MKSKKSIVAIVLFVLALLLIFALTLQNSNRSGGLSAVAQYLVQRLFEKLGIEADFSYYGAWSAYWFRKYAHTVEYLFLGFAAGLLLRKSKRGFLKAILLCAAISLLDQVIKIFVPGREFDLRDLPFDAIGYIVGALISLLFKKKE